MEILALNSEDRGKILEEARKMVYAEMERINFEGMRFRKDIGKAGI